MNLEHSFRYVCERETIKGVEAMNNDYTSAPATKMLATHCVACGRSLVDAKSVELGIGPECRQDFDVKNPSPEHKQANQHVHSASIAAQKGFVSEVFDHADKIRELGFPNLADKITKRFQRGVEKAETEPDIVIKQDSGYLYVRTPYRRKYAKEFTRAWRDIPGRKFDRVHKYNQVPESQKRAVWEILKAYFPGKWGKGPSGVFKVPSTKKKQQEFNLK